MSPCTHLIFLFVSSNFLTSHSLCALLKPSFFYIQHLMETLLIKVLVMLSILFGALLIRLLAAYNTSDYSFFETLFSLGFCGPYS